MQPAELRATLDLRSAGYLDLSKHTAFAVAKTKRPAVSPGVFDVK